jgi:hypothetical protein
VAAAEVWLNKLSIAVLPDPTPTAGTDPTTFPVADWLLPNALPDVLPVTVTILGSAAVAILGSAAVAILGSAAVAILGSAAVEDAASCTVSEEADAAGAVPAWRR